MSGDSYPRKRDLVRDLFRRSGKPSSNPAVTSQAGAPLPPRVKPDATASPPQTSPSTTPGQQFLDGALQALAPKEQATIQEHLVRGTRDIRIAVEEAYNAALNQKQSCEAKRLQWDFRGRRVFLRDEADKVLLWLDRFKSVGDVAANADPIHVGLPWAGIRMILKVSMCPVRTLELCATIAHHACR